MPNQIFEECLCKSEWVARPIYNTAPWQNVSEQTV